MLPRADNGSSSNIAFGQTLTFALIGLMVAVGTLPATGQERSPCLCQPRGTLLQWSYGTSFSGGPDREAPLVTDRPDFTEASVTVGRGVTQLEMGYLYVNDRGPGTSFAGQTAGMAMTSLLCGSQRSTTGTCSATRSRLAVCRTCSSTETLRLAHRLRLVGRLATANRLPTPQMNS